MTDADEERAREIVAHIMISSNTEHDVQRIASALRSTRTAALEEAEQKANEEAERQRAAQSGIGQFSDAAPYTAEQSARRIAAAIRAMRKEE